MKKVIVFLFFIFFVTTVYSETVKLTTLDWEPYIGQKLNNQGFVAEIVKEAFKRGGYDIEIQYYPWARTVDKAKKGEVDGYMPEYYSEELKNDFYVSEPFAGGPVGLFKRKGFDLKYEKLEDLKGYKIGVVRDYVNEENFDKATYLTKDEVTDDLTNIKKLLANRIDLFVADKFVGFYLLNEHMPEMTMQMEFVEPPLIVHDLYVCINKNVKDAKKKIDSFNKGLKEMKEDGSLDKMIKF
ncbi:MAG: transporter substrate-binding domain-containing protein [Candidatus Delongbacteria bacterium]|nr:transporter substrate-binding domain-containing protein [Candidatus Delongbacteria bacterium]MBN2834814.1 transporter substrate-binding domain-containing protein [Candidatus Delongbacteria bacterium]